ncbi:MAG TPA: hypothetical protein VNK95_17690, partial [Caldilineaceae bacterium]|nr:hypothetical protein [Caldilineaceae bacterium]
MNGSDSLLSLPVALIGSLLAAAAVTYLLRYWERLTALVGAGVVGFWAALLWQVDLAQPLWILPVGGQVVDLGAPLERMGFTLRLEPGAIPILVSSLLLAATAFLLAACLSQGRSFVPFTLALLAGYQSLALLITGPLAPPLLAPLVLAVLSGLG